MTHRRPSQAELVRPILDRLGLLTEEDITLVRGISVDLLRHERGLNGPPFVKWGGATYYRVEALKAWLKEQEQSGAAPSRRGERRDRDSGAVPAVPTIMTVAGAAARLALCQKSIRRMIASGDIACQRFGGAVRIPVADIERLERERPHEDEPEATDPVSAPILAPAPRKASTLVSSDPVARGREIGLSLRRH